MCKSLMQRTTAKTSLDSRTARLELLEEIKNREHESKSFLEKDLFYSHLNGQWKVLALYPYLLDAGVVPALIDFVVSI